MCAGSSWATLVLLRLQCKLHQAAAMCAGAYPPLAACVSPPAVQEWGLAGQYASPFGGAAVGPPPEAFATGSTHPSSAGGSHATSKLQKQASESSCLPCLRSAQSVQASWGSGAGGCGGGSIGLGPPTSACRPAGLPLPHLPMLPSALCRPSLQLQRSSSQSMAAIPKSAPLWLPPASGSLRPQQSVGSGGSGSSAAAGLAHGWGALPPHPHGAGSAEAEGSGSQDAQAAKDRQRLERLVEGDW